MFMFHMIKLISHPITCKPYRMVPPSDVCWFINPMNTIVLSAINHRFYGSYVNPNLAICLTGAPPNVPNSPPQLHLDLEFPLNHLVGGWPTPLKNMKVNGNDYPIIPYMKWKIKNVWNHQPAIVVEKLSFNVLGSFRWSQTRAENLRDSGVLQKHLW